MTVDAIKAAIEQLPEADRRGLADWLDEQEQNAWDLEIQRDLSVGGEGRHLFEKVNPQIDQRQFTPLDFEVPKPQSH